MYLLKFIMCGYSELPGFEWLFPVQIRKICDYCLLIYYLTISNFLMRSLVFPILLFSTISLHWSLRKSFLTLHAILWNSAFRWAYLSFSPLHFTSLIFSAIFKTYSDNHFAFLHFIFLGMVFITASQCHGPPSIVLQALCPSDLIHWIYLSLPLYNHKGFDLGHTWMA